MADKTILPIRDYDLISDDLVRRINAYAIEQTNTEIWRCRTDVQSRLYSELVRKITGYDMSVSKDLAHFVFEDDQEAIMFKLRFKDA